MIRFSLYVINNKETDYEDKEKRINSAGLRKEEDSEEGQTRIAHRVNILYILTQFLHQV